MSEEKDINGEPRLGRAEPVAQPKQAESSTRSEVEAMEDNQGASAQDLPADLAAAYKNILAEKQDLVDRLLRKQAEFENFRKRVHREKEDFLQHANVDLIRALLPVLDGFERALRNRDARVPESFYHGLELIHQEFLGVFARAGALPIETKGKTFDPHLHQAVETVEAKERRDQEIVEELQRGYMLKNRLLRPAIVKVAAGKK
jgi:molecular chaperone GrpE